MTALRSESWRFTPIGLRSARRVSDHSDTGHAGLLIRTFVLGLPAWWVLGLDWLVPPLMAFSLIFASISTFTKFRFADYLLFSVILSLAFSALINGLMIGEEPTRFLAAYYNIVVLSSSIIIMLSVRRMLEIDPEAQAFLKVCFISFLGLLLTIWACVTVAYTFRQFSLETPSVFGLLFGNLVPESAPLIRDSTHVVFTKPDWGLPGFPMPRIAAYAPYPTAAAAVVAVLGTMSLLYIQRRGRHRNLLIPLLEALIFISIAATLTRSILGGWVIGAVVSNLIFGSGIRRIFAMGLIVCTVVAAPNIQAASHVVEYRSYSSESRFDNYFYAAEQTFRQNAVFGIGIKPREDLNHIAVGSHSTFVSFFTKGGTLVLCLIVLYFLLLPAYRWLVVVTGISEPPGTPRAELRILLNLQIAVWIWLFFEDVDAPAIASALIFLSLAFIERALQGRPEAAAVGSYAPSLHWSKNKTEQPDDSH